jgi:DNA invertase Pin-like site-specific DNA recombinase
MAPLIPPRPLGNSSFISFRPSPSLERRLIQERTRAGLVAARARGKIGGRRPVRPDNPRVQMAYALSTAQSLTAAEICQVLRISPATFYRYVALGRHTAERT